MKIQLQIHDRTDYIFDVFLFVISRYDNYFFQNTCLIDKPKFTLNTGMPYQHIFYKA
jgi:hypothetical protein